MTTAIPAATIPIDTPTDAAAAEPTVPSAQICILGGGFGGLYTALRLQQLPWAGTKPTITLVDQNDRFVFLPLLYELVTGELQIWEIAPPYTEILANTGIQFIQSSVTQIDLDPAQITLARGDVLRYDRLVLALGGETPLDTVPGAATHAIPFRSLSDAYRLEEHLHRLETSGQERIKIAIIGAGPSGVELACKLSDRLGERGRIRLIDRHEQILRYASTFSQTAAQQALAQRNVLLDLETEPTEIAADYLCLNYRNQVDRIPVDLVLWTVGTTPSALIRQLPLPHNPQGQLLTTPTLQVLNHPQLFALGDLADCKDSQGNPIPRTAQAAFQQADYAGWNLWAGLNQRPLLPFRYNHLGEMLTLGTESAALSGLGVQLDGPAAYLMRRLAYLYRMPTLEHQLKVGFNWVLQPFLAAMNPG